jgi:hypothetical protein
MFLQIDERHTPLTVLHLFFPTLPIIWAQVAAKRFWGIQYSGPLKLQKNVKRPNTICTNTCRLIPISTHRSFRWTLPLRGFLL